MKNCWISPEGHIIEVIGSHYDAVFRNKDRYGLTGSHFQLARGKDPKNVQGVILTQLMGKGWTRVTVKDGKYLVEFDKWSLKHRGNVKKWMKQKEDILKVELVSLDGKFLKSVLFRHQV
ncbi:MAG: hypothetical protein KKG02_11505 [Candidatus Edwardsbacteria bacterium]|nr:hypothetical protein [Candidatus Edwardsbacteria bacterium]